jgi:hypothetical protein
MARTVALAMASLCAAGCYTSWDIGPRELPKLKGYSAPDNVELVSGAGERFAYGPESHLVFVEGAKGTKAAEIDDIRLDGPLLRGTDRQGGQPFAIDLRGVSLVRVEQFSQGRTVGLVLGITAGAAAIAGLVALGLSLRAPSHRSSSYGCFLCESP